MPDRAVEKRKILLLLSLLPILQADAASRRRENKNVGDNSRRAWGKTAAGRSTIYIGDVDVFQVPVRCHRA